MDTMTESRARGQDLRRKPTGVPVSEADIPQRSVCQPLQRDMWDELASVKNGICDTHSFARRRDQNKALGFGDPEHKRFDLELRPPCHC